ncbi:unnamed protein product [Rhizoctonia solani]|uniref:Tafazzin family protein n=1 Tax=Rhizoctonia solani TaxID=456999 RepID=A0A8H3GY10_9AGAM|nr:unnamed protein product [Rhizoctonia solani]
MGDSGEAQTRRWNYRRGHNHLTTPSMGIGSRLTIAAIALGSKLFLNTACASVKVHGLRHLLTALDEVGRKDRGIITVANHISVIDDPVVWGTLPVRQCIVNPRNMRWTMGASDIMFTNAFYNWFFRNGQVIETVRGAGVHQPAVDISVAKLNSGAWVHVFPEGQVNQKSCQAGGDLLRFKWGVPSQSGVLSSWWQSVTVQMGRGPYDNVNDQNSRGHSNAYNRVRKGYARAPPIQIFASDRATHLDYVWRTRSIDARGRQIGAKVAIKSAINPFARAAHGCIAASPRGRGVELGRRDTARLSGEVRKQAIDNLGKAIDWTDEERARVDIVALLQKGVADLALSAHPPLAE